MTELHLAEGVFAVDVDRELVLLDLRHDAYHCLVDGAPLLAGPAWSGLLTAEAETLLGPAGLTAGAAAPGRRPLPTRPTSTIIHETGSARISPQAFTAGAASSLKTLKASRRPGLASQLAVSGDGIAGSASAIVEEARAFWKLLPWLPIDGECVQRSAVLAAFLRRRGLKADWVVAVRLWPFRAHCWLQCGDICLNDDYERLAAFTPIYVR
ncbi:lasso peptide biosynthesis B2 protein [Brevundimonas nasdae]|uniref:Lasso peptide biosynthesis B2 protein n=1 Tax=Brevundimonas nasdae TaxID=172043 RepID=A0ABX8TKB7_9CAUL|nr:lasso peptide biosynthesis B2 protein [Brevundimonas nasdae]QYC11449.1 lasso peptide biosynthesis B2 protein [Brevundimonas nasdae]QYC14237.1 lasso peptide biosynthesis B2 protein [Brevundimonas nasdae]